MIALSPSTTEALTAFELYQQYQQDSLTFIYQGEFSDDITEDILRLNEHRLERAEHAGKVRKKMTFLIAECFQNVVRHADRPEIINQTNDKPSHFMLRHRPEGYHVASANLMNNLEVDKLERHLQNLNQLDAAQLRELYLEVLANQGFGRGCAPALRVQIRDQGALAGLH